MTITTEIFPNGWSFTFIPNSERPGPDWTPPTDSYCLFVVRGTTAVFRRSTENNYPNDYGWSGRYYSQYDQYWTAPGFNGLAIAHHGYLPGINCAKTISEHGITALDAEMDVLRDTLRPELAGQPPEPDVRMARFWVGFASGRFLVREPDEDDRRDVEFMKGLKQAAEWNRWADMLNLPKPRAFSYGKFRSVVGDAAVRKWTNQPSSVDIDDVPF